LTHYQVPANDGGISLGQAVIAANLYLDKEDKVAMNTVFRSTLKVKTEDYKYGRLSGQEPVPYFRLLFQGWYFKLVKNVKFLYFSYLIYY